MRNVATKILSAFGSLALTTALVGVADPAVASTPAAPRQSISYTQTDLNTAEGRAALHQRIEDASKAVCRSDDADQDAQSRCQARAKADADQALFAQLTASR